MTMQHENILAEDERVVTPSEVMRCNTKEFLRQPVAMGESKRQTIQVTPESLAAFKIACSRGPIKMTMQDVSSQLLMWFSRQDSRVQTAIISAVDDGFELIYAEMLERMAFDLRNRGNLPTADDGDEGEDDSGSLAKIGPKTPPNIPGMHRASESDKFKRGAAKSGSTQQRLDEEKDKKKRGK